MNRVVKIDSINKKMMRVEGRKVGVEGEEGGERYWLQIEGKVFKYDVNGYFKLWFENKKRQYLAVAYEKEGIHGHISIINDKL